MQATGIEGVDWLIIGLYFAIVIAISLSLSGWWKNKSTKSSEGYFLGGRQFGWVAIGASLFASNIGSEHLIGLAGQGASGAFVASQFELLASFMLLLLGWLFVPFYLKTGVFTMPEFLEKRYGPKARNYLSWLSIAGYVLTKISVTIAAGGIVFTTLLGIDFWTGALLIVVITGAYTALGGLRAVIYTDLMQMIILIGGAITVTFMGMSEIGGIGQLKASIGPDHLSLWRPITDANFPWTGILFGAPILGVWYWCTDQFIVQRVLSAKSQQAARNGTIFAAYLKLLPMFIFVLPGVIAFGLAADPANGLQFTDGEGGNNYDAALPMLVMHVLPSGLKGVVIAGLLAALMSSLSSVFNSCSTLFTMDIYRKFKPAAKELELVRVGQLATVALVLLSLLWIPFFNQINGGIFQKLQSIQAYIAPPIAAVFLLGIIVPRLNERGAMTSMIVGAILGTARLALEVLQIELPSTLQWFLEMNFLHFALMLFILCSGILVLISFQSRAPAPASLQLQLNDIRWNIVSDRKAMLLSVGVIMMVLVIWLLF